MNNDFYVGYLPAPAGLKRFAIVVAVILVITGAGFAAVTSSSQKAAGNGTWAPANAVTLTGRLSVSPYPVLHKPDGQDVILVVQGKQGADEFALPHAGKAVSITGFPIERGGWSMLEIPGADAISPADVDAPAVPGVEVLGPVSLRGEIVDSKCFLGVMKPGSGKVHRACAALCLLGGMPPMFVVKAEDGNKYGYVMTLADGSHASRAMAPMVALPVSITGTVERRGDLLSLRVDDGSITPLAGTDLKRFGDTLAVSMETGEFCGVMTEAS